MVMSCPAWADGRGEVFRKAKRPSTFAAMIKDQEDIKRITKWILTKGWTEQFRLAPQVEALIQERQNKKERRSPRAS